MRKMAGVNRSTIYRWMGEGGIDAPQPDRIPLQSLAWAIESRYPELARDLVKAAGHPWEDAPENEHSPPSPLEELLGSAEEAERIRDKIRARKGADAQWYINALDDVLRQPAEDDDECPGPAGEPARRQG